MKKSIKLLTAAVTMMFSFNTDACSLRGKPEGITSNALDSALDIIRLGTSETEQLSEQGKNRRAEILRRVGGGRFLACREAAKSACEKLKSVHTVADGLFSAAPIHNDALGADITEEDILGIQNSLKKLSEADAKEIQTRLNKACRSLQSAVEMQLYYILRIRSFIRREIADVPEFIQQSDDAGNLSLSEQIKASFKMVSSLMGRVEQLQNFIDSNEGFVDEYIERCAKERNKAELKNGLDFFVSATSWLSNMGSSYRSTCYDMRRVFVSLAPFLPEKIGKCILDYRVL